MPGIGKGVNWICGSTYLFLRPAAPNGELAVKPVQRVPAAVAVLPFPVPGRCRPGLYRRTPSIPARVAITEAPGSAQKEPA